MRIVQIGELARVALARSHGIALPMAAFADAPYLEAAGEIVWIGARLPALHPRAVVTTVAQPRGVALHFDSLPDRGWSAQLPVLDEAATHTVIAGVKRLRQTLAGTATARGFGTLLAGRTPAFPLDIAVPRVSALAAAYGCGDVDAVIETSLGLLGFGAGLTPSGDDLVGAALFGRRFVAPRNRGWAVAAATLSREIGTRSHAISAALFGDLARGQSFAPLHAVAEALACGDDDGALHAARTLTEIGHTSGWDVITGFIIGSAGNPDRDSISSANANTILCMTSKSDKSNNEWREALTPEQYQVLRKEGTERSFTSPLNDEHRKGTFVCAGCGHPLFTNDMKFDSGTGWPSFFKTLDNAFETKTDHKLFMQRTEYHCANCGGHHGHVFEDGPEPTGLRYCNNGVALRFEADE